MTKYYSDADKARIKDAVIEWISEGKTLREFCRQDGMPSYGAVYDWEEIDKDFASRIARARLIGEEVIAQECLTIADTPREGVRIKINEDGKEEIHEDMLGHRKLQVETRLKLLAKWNPRKWGEKVGLEHTGADGGPIQHEVRPFTAMYADMGKCDGGKD